MVALKSFRHSGPSFADLVPYAGLVDNGVILLKDGSLMAGWYFAGTRQRELDRRRAQRGVAADQRDPVSARLRSG